MGSTELVYEVLDAIDSGNHKPTHILFSARLNWRIYKRLIKKLEKNHYIEQLESDDTSTRNKVKYYLTDDGKEALNGMKYLQKIFS